MMALFCTFWVRPWLGRRLCSPEHVLPHVAGAEAIQQVGARAYQMEERLYLLEAATT